MHFILLVQIIVFMLQYSKCNSWRSSVGRKLRKLVGSRYLHAHVNDESLNVADAIPEHFQSLFLKTMKERGFIHQCTSFGALDEKVHSGAITAYLGFDATARSLHVGSLLQIMILRTLQQCGHKPIILIGGGTTKIGDPSGKDESRQLLEDTQIRENAKSLSRVFEKYIKFGDGPTDAIMVNNADWLDNIKYLDFLRDYGRYFTINRMLSFDSVKQRLEREQPLTFLEFNYMLLQSYDFLELSKRYNVCLQLGGSDQWGNIVGGVELARKLKHKTGLFGLTTPLVTTSDGRKMGKSAAGAVWLDKDLLSEFDYWQFWRNTADADVIRFLKLFTDLPMEQIAEYEKLSGADLNAVKIVLADETTRMLHGPECLVHIHSTVASLFAASAGKGGSASDLQSLPQVSITGADWQKPADGGELAKITVVDLLIKAGFATSKGEARRLIALGGARVNDCKVEDEKAVVTARDFGEKGRMKLSGSKKKHALIINS